MEYNYTVSNAGNTNYTFKTESEALVFFNSHTGKNNPLWMYRDFPFKMIKEYTPS